MVRLCLVTVLLVLAGTAAQAAPLPVQTLRIDRKAPTHTIAIAYPKTGNGAIDAEIAAWAKHEADEFAGYTKDARLDDPGRPWSLEITCKVARNDAAMFAVMCASATNDDGNHTHFAFTTFDYVMPAAQRISISNVMKPEAYAKMRAYAVAHMVSEDPDFGAEVAADVGLPPVAATFAAFTLSPTAITVWFTPEQLGNMTSAGGHAVIPLSELKGLLRPF